MIAGECAPPYVNPFKNQPLRLLWWVDENLHRLHVPWWLQRWTCDYIERRIQKDGH